MIFPVSDSIEQLLRGTFWFFLFHSEECYIVWQILDSMNKFLRVECGFAAVKDIRAMNHEDR